ncbi:hypothetical protein BV898_17637 [Hypsibius exemplaris]|uniref:Uncharacterized protein n=1 Tax=Hypsibius exemplaris TaxID=2072580 RepID=A0A9X6NH86_HYPEX|nr:hypothetical protein BV898_17637 [Hypsibius exemplaris]
MADVPVAVPDAVELLKENRISSLDIPKEVPDAVALLQENGISSLDILKAVFKKIKSTTTEVDELLRVASATLFREKSDIDYADWSTILVSSLKLPTTLYILYVIWSDSVQFVDAKQKTVEPLDKADSFVLCKVGHTEMKEFEHWITKDLIYTATSRSRKTKFNFETKPETIREFKMPTKDEVLCGLMLEFKKKARINNYATRLSGICKMLKDQVAEHNNMNVAQQMMFALDSADNDTVQKFENLLRKKLSVHQEQIHPNMISEPAKAKKRTDADVAEGKKGLLLHPKSAPTEWILSTKNIIGKYDQFIKEKGMWIKSAEVESVEYEKSTQDMIERYKAKFPKDLHMSWTTPADKKSEKKSVLLKFKPFPK